MAAIDPLQLALIFVAIALGGFSKGVTGIGLPLMAMPILANVVGVERAVVILTLPSIVSNGWLVIANRHAAPPFTALAGFLAAGIIGGIFGTWLLAVVSERILMLGLAIWLALYLGQLVLKPHFRLPVPHILAPAFGLAAGAVQGATSVSAPIVAAYLTGIGLAKGAFVFSVALSFTLFSFSQIAAMAHYDLLSASRMFEGIVALVPTLLFLRAGVRWGSAISVDLFRKIMIFVFVLTEARLIYVGLTG